MTPLNHDITFTDLKDKIGQKITHHLVDLDRTKKDDKQKILELCHIGELLATYYSDIDIYRYPHFQTSVVNFEVEYLVKKFILSLVLYLVAGVTFSIETCNLS